MSPVESSHEKKEINEISFIDIQNKSIIDNLNDKIETQNNISIQGMSIIPINSIKDNSISPDCNSGLSIVPSSLLSAIMKVDINSVLFPLLNIRKSCFRKLSVEQIMTWQKRELTESLLKMEEEYDKQFLEDLLNGKYKNINLSNKQIKYLYEELRKYLYNKVPNKSV